MNNADQPDQVVSPKRELVQTIEQAVAMFAESSDRRTAELRPEEYGRVIEVARGIAQVAGLPDVQSDERLLFSNGIQGFAFNLDQHRVGCVLLDEGADLKAGSRVHRTRQMLDTPVGDELLGRVIDPLGRPLDGGRELTAAQRMPCERDAPPIMDRAPVTVPLQTGVKVIDALIPIGRGQRQLILGDRQTGKTAIALDTIVNQRGQDVVCIYCSIGQRSTNVARVIANLRKFSALDHAVVVIGPDDAPPGIQFIAPYAATTIGEHFMQQGKDVLIIYDDLTSHARAYRHLSLLLRRPPGREAFPGDIFYVHSRLLERSTHLKDELGGGSMTALPIIETEAQNVAAYIPTNLISITDGQIYLSPRLFHKGLLPAVDVGRSVSRVGGKTQLPAYRAVVGDLRLTYSQFEELEKFARFSSQLDEETKAVIERGRRIREILKQREFHPLTVPEQIVSLIAVTSGVLDSFPLNQLSTIEPFLWQTLSVELPDVCDLIRSGKKLRPDDIQRFENFVSQRVTEFSAAHSLSQGQE